MSQPSTDRLFAQLARRYDRFNRWSSLTLDRWWRKRAARAAGRDGVLLDLAAGSGDLSLAVARQGWSGSIVCADPVPQMLALAQKKAQARPGQARWHFAQGNAQALPFADGSFHAVTAAFGVRNFADRPTCYREVLRVLRPGGRFVILEFSRPTWRPFRRLYYWYLRTIMPWVGRLLTGEREPFRYLESSIRAFPPQQALAAELEQAGFAKAGWTNLSGGIVALHLAHKPAAPPTS